MASKALKEAGWRLIVPEIRKVIREELVPTNGRIDALEKRMDTLDTKIDDVRDLMVDKFTAVNERLDALKERYDVAKDIVALQTRVGELEKRLVPG